jgi:glucose-6-phosphate dehydrogenase assembly protein OpcA
VRYRPGSDVAALLLVGWLASRLGWRAGELTSRAAGRRGRARAKRGEVSIVLDASDGMRVPGLAGIELETADGMTLCLDRGTGGLQAKLRDPKGRERAWTVLGASRGEPGILGEGIRQALLRDPTFKGALVAARAML